MIILKRLLVMLQIMVAGIGLPFLGYLAGLLMGTACKQKPEDVMAISIETGVQNTGIAIFLLKFCLPQPAADLTTGKILSQSYALLLKSNPSLPRWWWDALFYCYIGFS